MSGKQTTRVEFHGDDMRDTTTGHASVNTADHTPGVAYGRVVTGIRNGFSGVPASQLQPTDHVSLNGQKVTVEVAETMGWLIRDAQSGGWRLPSTSEQQAQAQREQQADEQRQREEAEANKGESYMRPEDDAEAADLFQRGGGEMVGVASAIVNNGEPNETQIGAAASRLGIEPGQLRDKIEHMKVAYTTDAAGMARKQTGCSDEGAREAFAWAGQNGMGREQMNQHMTTGKANYSDLIIAHQLHTMQTNPQRWIDAAAETPGVSIKQGAQGELVFTDAKGSVLLETAIRTRRVSL